MSPKSFAQSIHSRLCAGGLAQASIVSARSDDAQRFGDSEAIFGLDSLQLRFIRDRGQEFLDIASSETPHDFHQFDDVALDQGWTTLAKLVATSTPDPMDHVLRLVRDHLNELREMFGREAYESTNSRLRMVADKRAQTFRERIARHRV